MGYILGLVPMKLTAFGVGSFENSILKSSSLEDVLLDLMAQTRSSVSIDLVDEEIKN